QRSTASRRERFDCIGLLRRHAIFGKLGQAQLRRVCALASVRKVDEGTTVYAKGDAATAMYGVCAGAVTVAAPSIEPGETAPDVRTAGGLFGERALLGGEPRLSDAVTAADCELMVIKRRDFQALLLANPKLALKLIELLGSQLSLARVRIEEAAHLTVSTRLA